MQVYNMYIVYILIDGHRRRASVIAANCKLQYSSFRRSSSGGYVIILLCTLARVYRLIYNYTVCAQDVVVLYYVRAQVVERIMNVSRVGSRHSGGAPSNR